MTDKKVLWIRILIAMATFIALFGTLISFFKNWFPGPIYIVLYIIAFFTLANGVSYLAEILKKDRRYLKILTGIFSVMIFVFTLIPPDQNASQIIGLIMIVGLSGSSILISVFSVLEWAQIKKRFRWIFLFLFAFNSGVYGCLIFAMILRNYNSFEGGIILIGYGAILFFFSMIANLFAVSSLKIKIGGKQ